jgi:hypothetical protein
MRLNPSLEGAIRPATKKYPNMEPESSQEPSITPYPEADQCNAYDLILLLQDTFYCYSPTYVYIFLVDFSFWLSHQNSV